MSKITNPPSIFEFLVGSAGELCVVEMGAVGFADFQTWRAIGTFGLNSCSVVIISSEKGAILAHIPPRPISADPADPYAGDLNVQAMMQQVRDLYVTGANHGYFPAPATPLPSSSLPSASSSSLSHFSSSSSSSAAGHVLCAIFETTVALPHQVAIMQQELLDIGLAAQLLYYHVPADRDDPANGTVVVLPNRRPGTLPGIYVANVPVTDASTRMSAAEFDMMVSEQKAKANKQHSTSSGVFGTGQLQQGLGQEQTVQSEMETGLFEAVSGHSLAWSASDQWTATSGIDTVTGHSESQFYTYDFSGPVHEAAGVDFGEMMSSDVGQPVQTGSANAESSTGTQSWTNQEPAVDMAETPANIWIEVKVTKEQHMFREDQYIFSDKKNRKIFSRRADWKKVTQDNYSVYTFVKGSTTYYTSQKIF